MPSGNIIIQVCILCYVAIVVELFVHAHKHYTNFSQYSDM